MNPKNLVTSTPAQRKSRIKKRKQVIKKETQEELFPPTVEPELVTLAEAIVAIQKGTADFAVSNTGNYKLVKSPTLLYVVDTNGELVNSEFSFPPQSRSLWQCVKKF